MIERVGLHGEGSVIDDREGRAVEAWGGECYRWSRG